MTFQFEGFEARLHIDVETFSEVDIRQAGAHAYAQHPSTEVLMVYFAFNDDEPIEWDIHQGQPVPAGFVELLRDPRVAKVAFNAAFERLIFKHVLGEDIPAEQWRCTMVAAYYLGFTGGLGNVIDAIGLEEKKDTRGARLIQKFCKPAPSNHTAKRYTAENSAGEYQELKEYCRQDVVSERGLLLWIVQFPQMPLWDWHRYVLDQRINDRGVFIDTKMAQGAQDLWAQEKSDLEDQLRELTGLSKVTRGPFAAWLEEQGADGSSLRKEVLSAVTEPPHVVEAISLWIEKEGKAVSKYTAMLRGTCTDGRAKGLFQFKGAARTDRTAGRRIQLQNLRRSFVKGDVEFQMDLIVDAIRKGSSPLLKLVTGMNTSDALGGSVRHAIQAAPGNTLVVYDLASIESVILGWLTLCDKIDHTFRSGRDTYRVFASEYFGVQYDDVTSEQRGFSKPPVLGCGYMLGAKGLVAYAEGYGVNMSESESSRAVNTFRSMYPEIPKFWSWINDAAKYVTVTGQPLEGYRLRLERDASFLRIWLPSGRALSYFLPTVERRIAPWAEVTVPHRPEGTTMNDLRSLYRGKDDQHIAASEGINTEDSDWVDNFSYMGTDQMTNQWVRSHAHAGLLTENIVQSIALDVLFEGIEKAEDAGLPVVLQVHDELAVEVPLAEADRAAQTLQHCMVQIPKWADGLWLGAEGYISRIYMKD